MMRTQSIKEFLGNLSSSSPAPGGGSVAALSGALAAGLVAMVCRLTIGKKKYADVEADMLEILPHAESLREEFLQLADEDTDAFNEVMRAYGMPKETDAEKQVRGEAIQKAMHVAADVPYEVLEMCREGLELSREVASKGNTNSISDAGVSALMFYAAAFSAALNVRINLGSFSDQEDVARRSENVHDIMSVVQDLRDGVLTIVESKLG